MSTGRNANQTQVDSQGRVLINGTRLDKMSSPALRWHHRDLMEVVTIQERGARDGIMATPKLSRYRDELCYVGGEIRRRELVSDRSEEGR